MYERVHDRGELIERWIGLKWRVASLPDNSQRFSLRLGLIIIYSMLFRAQPCIRIPNILYSVYTCAHTHICIFHRYNSLSRPNSLSHVRSPHRSISSQSLLSLFLLQKTQSYSTVESRHRMNHKKVLIRSNCRGSHERDKLPLIKHLFS